MTEERTREPRGRNSPPPPEEEGGTAVAEHQTVEVPELDEETVQDLAKAVENAIATTGHHPDSIRVRGVFLTRAQIEAALSPVGDLQLPKTVLEEPPPMVPYWAAPGQYITQEHHFIASTSGLRITGITVAKDQVAADANGDRILKAGTVLAAYDTTRAKPKMAAEVAIGICTMTVNLRDVDQEVGMLIAGAVNSLYIWDNGVYGATAGTTVANLPFVQFVTRDV